MNGLRSRTIVLQSKSEAKGYHHSERVFNENNSLVKKIEMGWNEQSSMSRGSIGLSRYGLSMDMAQTGVKFAHHDGSDSRTSVGHHRNHQSSM